MNILIAGGTGFLGGHIARQLEHTGHEIFFLSRKKCADSRYYYWNPQQNELDPACLQNKDIVINLSGAGIADRIWSSRYKRIIYESSW